MACLRARRESRAPTAAIATNAAVRPAMNAATTARAMAGPAASPAAAPTPTAIGAHPGQPTTPNTSPKEKASVGAGGMAPTRRQRLVRRRSSRSPSPPSSRAAVRWRTSPARVRKSLTSTIAAPNSARTPSIPATNARTEGTDRSSWSPLGPPGPTTRGETAETTTGMVGHAVGDTVRSAPARTASAGARSVASAIVSRSCSSMSPTEPRGRLRADTDKSVTALCRPDARRELGVRGADTTVRRWQRDRRREGNMKSSTPQKEDLPAAAAGSASHSQISISTLRSRS